MITAKEINNKRFEQAKPGYSPNEVDDFLREISLQITKYQKDKEETEKKIEVLVESVREYKKDEDALKDALIGAQKQGRAVIAEAQAQADKIISDATVKAGEIIGGTKIQLEKEKRNLAKMQQEVTDFKANLLAMYKSHLAQITAIPDFDEDDTEEEEISEKPVLNTETKQSMADVSYEQSYQNVASAVDIDSTRAFNAAGASPIADSSAARNSRFSDLKFGENR